MWGCSTPASPYSRKEGCNTPVGQADTHRWHAVHLLVKWFIPNDPGGLLRNKFRFQYQRSETDQDGNPLWPDDNVQPW